MSGPGMEAVAQRHHAGPPLVPDRHGKSGSDPEAVALRHHVVHLLMSDRHGTSAPAPEVVAQRHHGVPAFVAALHSTSRPGAEMEGLLLHGGKGIGGRVPAIPFGQGTNRCVATSDWAVSSERVHPNSIVTEGDFGYDRLCAVPGYRRNGCRWVPASTRRPGFPGRGTAARGSRAITPIRGCL